MRFLSRLAPPRSTRSATSQRSSNQLAGLALAAFIATLMLSLPALAHVKWFSKVAGKTAPLSLGEIVTPTFLGLMALSMAGLALCVVLDDWAAKSPRLVELSDWFESRKAADVLVMRVAAFATLLVAWQQGTLLTPELAIDNVWVERLQFVVLALLLFRKTTTLAGVGLLGLWLYGAYSFGLGHMLDYLNAAGFAYFLIVRPLNNDWWRASALPVLYFTVGLSLLWLGAEKLVYPDWTLYLLKQNPVLAMGLPPRFFLTSAAFVELGLGFMLMICLFSRSLSITITLVFFMTTAIFGKVEIIGHTLIHASLIVFLLEGPGHTFTPPALFHRTKPLRIAFATVNFAVVVFGIVFSYTTFAVGFTPAPDAHAHALYEVPNQAAAPTISIHLKPDNMSGYNLQLTTTHFRFAPESAGLAHREGEGHAHLYVDGNKVARIYGPNYHLPDPGTGSHSVRVTLNTNDHNEYALNGEAIDAETTFTAP